MAITRIDFEPVFLEPPYLSEIDELRRNVMEIDKYECTHCSWTGNDEDLDCGDCPACFGEVTLIAEYDITEVLQEV